MGNSTIMLNMSGNDRHALDLILNTEGQLCYDSRHAVPLFPGRR
jgi:hypothetical protein